MARFFVGSHGLISLAPRRAEETSLSGQGRSAKPGAFAVTAVLAHSVFA